MSMRDIFDQLAEGFGKAVADIRNELVDRGWFGRGSATPQGQEPTMSEALGWTTRAEREQRGLQEPTRQPDHDLKRENEISR